MLLLQRFVLAVSFAISVLNSTAQTDSTISTKKWWHKFRPDSLVNKNWSFLPIPTLSSSPETGLKAGIAINYFFNTDQKKAGSTTRDSYAYLDLQYSTRNQLFTELYAQTFTSGERYFLRGRIGYADNYERLWGFGNNTVNNKAFEGVTYQRIYSNINAYKQVKNKFFVGIRGNLSITNNIQTPAKDTNFLTAQAGQKQSTVTGLGPTVLWDHRNHPLSPRSGWYTELGVTFHNKALGGNFNYTEWLIDARKYYPLGEFSCLSFQVFAQLNNGNVPWRELPRMGNPTIMRGYFNGRFRDNNYVAAQTEVRFPVHRLANLAFFGSIGQVNRTLKAMSLTDIRVAGGTGLRFIANRKKNITLRFDYAITTDANSGFYIKIGEAF
jgi:outer membrane protein assembly factor BamA